MSCNKHKNQQGQSLIELLVAMAVFVLVVSSIMFLTLDAHLATRQGAERTQATFLVQEGVEATYSIKNRGWKYLTIGSHGLDESGNLWEFSGAENLIDKYTRQVTVEEAYRDVNGDIVDSGGSVDLDTKKITSRVNWDFSPNRPLEVAVTSYLTNWRSAKWLQTTRADFDQGTKNNVVSTNNNGGELELSQGAGNYFGNQFLVEGISSVGDMNRADRRTAMRFTAQSSKSVNTVRVYLETEQGSSPVYRYGLQSDNGGEPSGAWLGNSSQGYGDWQATTTGWQTVNLNEDADIVLGSIYHLVVEWQSGTVNNRNYISLRQSDPHNLLFPYDNTADVNSNVLWHRNRWVAQDTQPIYLLGFTDATFEGNSYHDFTEEAIYSNQFIGEQFTISGGDKEISQVDFYVKKNRRQDPADDLYVTLYDITQSVQIDQGILVTAAAVSRNFTWYSYGFSSTVTLLDGHQYRIYLSSPGSNNLRYYQVLRIFNLDQADYNSVNYQGINFAYTGSINSGSTWNNSNNADIGGYRFSLVTSYALLGDFISSDLDTQSDDAVQNYLLWTATLPVGTTLQIQLRTADTQANLSVALCVGPDGTTATFYDTSGQIIANDPAASGTRWVQYKIYFTSDGTTTPVLSDITIDYES